MMNLVIGITIGIACAIALAVMWRIAERLRQELLARSDQAGEGKASGVSKRSDDALGGG
jgi:MFS superfamily sulfate permease-like transporter